MATAKKPEAEAKKSYEGQPLPPAEDPSFHVEEWPEAYANPHVEGGDAPAADSGTTSSGSGTSS